MLIPAPPARSGGDGDDDPLDRPALAGAAPRGNALLLSVTRAGPRLVAVGEAGTVLLSDDEGRTWRQAAAPVSVTLTAVHFPRPLQGWAVGHFGVVLESRDGGLRWEKRLERRPAPDDPDQPLFDVTFLDPQRGFVVGAHGLILATRDGGRSWLPWQHHLTDRRARHLYGVRGQAGHLYVAGEQGAFYRSSDEGETFQPSGPAHEGSFFGVLAGPQPGRVLVFGLGGRAFFSADAALHWSPSETETSSSLNAGLALADGSLLLSAQSGVLLRSGDGGRRFSPLPGRLASPAWGLLETADQAWLAVGARGAVRLPARARGGSEN